MPADAAKLCPDLFPNREAAKKAYQRDRLQDVVRAAEVGDIALIEYVFY